MNIEHYKYFAASFPNIIYKSEQMRKQQPNSRLSNIHKATAPRSKPSVYASLVASSDASHTASRLTSRLNSSYVVDTRRSELRVTGGY